MKQLDYKTWADKYGFDELEEYSIEMAQEDSHYTFDEDEWLSEAYESYLSELEDSEYENYRDDCLFGRV